MKTQILKIATILFITIFTISCGGSDDAPSPPVTDYFMRAKIDGVQFEALAPRILAGRTADRITITAALPDLRNFEIYIDDYPSNPVGSYTIPATSGTTYSASLRFGDGTSIFSAVSCCGLECAIGTRGNLEITSISATEISGTFSFIGTQTSGTCPRLKKIVTEGSFKSGITL